ncbi:MAG: hypothetical protein COW19_01960 [Zetaproteobacteria bacterium CG12_big_fil_rev_8_21_14_0_65_55_1124]|nr:MAG: hypothetical protein AUJ58_10090 [Zetaproteobacteria bacterium CG1_02_55_237]PIS19946.1 MAG: hypothetical protein COT53_02850 [Zetaproteobacteria bacterium CG08_land_8_20_14_0_20_55_17]PIW43632.1 MAG: hypothetical protein COW19_01960 [Zetaproteobacteria bacterium CG12_big_fil_rev_8_21_14_0_65_55_1124]PIZ37884.1 MAG: hypothetical protein COY36_07965 [Zetaproteobacteria bacterium CG_4_10_14_0_2_um_filter_55_20]PJB80488.1 MAG: hypothetical protein CO089_07130 [Zetaproteobacteria bacterium 
MITEDTKQAAISNTEKACGKMAKAERISASGDARPHEMIMANCLVKEADNLMAVDSDSLELESGEVKAHSSKQSMYPLTESPDMAAVESSIQRMELSGGVDCLSIGIDTANSIKAKDTPERMLAHQMAACHKVAFNLMREAEQIDARYRLDANTASVIQSRKLNSANRLMQTFQQAMLTLQKMRTGGKQVMTVQHVQVNDGGQAIVAGGDAGRSNGEKE